MNNKGVMLSLLSVTVTLFVIAIVGLVSTLMWTEYIQVFEDMPTSTTYTQETKDKIISLEGLVFINDKLFIIMYLVLSVGLLISSTIISTQKPWLFVVYLFFLVVITLLSMLLSNSWGVVSSGEIFTSSMEHYNLTDYVLRFYPVLTFIVGLASGIIFYGRSIKESDGGNVDGGF